MISSGIDIELNFDPIITVIEQPADTLFETDSSLENTPEGAVELVSGTFASALLGKDVPFRVFSPLAPEWETEEYKFQKEGKVSPIGMPLAIYSLNLSTTAPRPSSASDREIIEDLIKRQFLVVTVDFDGGIVTDHLEWSKDIHGLIHVFGGSNHTGMPWYTENRKQLLNIPGPHEGKAFTSFPFPSDSDIDSLPVHTNRIYLLPPGYTVDYYHVFKENFEQRNRPELFLDIIFPMPADNTEKIPLLLEISSTGYGNDVINANAFILYSWLFNGYAFASTCHVKPLEENADKYPFVHAIRYLRWKKEHFSLNGVVSTAGISKAARRSFSESNFIPRETVVDLEPYGQESSKVSVTMPAVSAGRHLDDQLFQDFPIWEHLHEDSPAAVLTWNLLNKDGADNGTRYHVVRDAYLEKGWDDKLYYREVPLGGHEYDIYDLNEIMAFWDKFCK